jgi:dienelactone hydrolase
LDKENDHNPHLRRMTMRKRLLVIMTSISILFAVQVYAEAPNISNLRFSDDPITLGEYFTISFEFEGNIDKFVIENTWETKDGQIKREVKEFPIKPEFKEKPRGFFSFRWKSENPTAKPYRIMKVWVKDAAGNQSNALSGEVKVTKDVPGEEVKIPMELKSVFGTKIIHLSAVIYKPDTGEKFPLVVMNHGTPRKDEDRKRTEKFKEQSKVFVKRGFAVVVPMRRGYGTSEGEYAEYSGKCDNSDYDNVAKEVVKDIRATIEFMKKQAYIDTGKKILMVGQSAGGFSSLAYTNAYPEEIVAVINFAGGKGSIEPYKVCSEERLVHTMSNFGEKIQMSTLWVYTEQDDFFPPKLSKKMFEEFRKKGGEGKFILLSSELGHSFFHRTTKEWEPIVDEFLKEKNLIQ